MFEYQFMRTAFLIGGLLAIIIPLIGNLVVYKRMSMVGDALSHISLSGIALGIILNINPILGALMMAIVAGLSIQTIQRKLGQYTELAIAIIMSLGIGLSAILMSFVGQPNLFNTFLFGSIIAIAGSDALLAGGLALLVVIVTLLYYRDFFFVAFDETSAHLAGINVNYINTVFMILTAITVSIASRIVGSLIVSSLLILPSASAMQVAKSYRQTMSYGVLFSVLSVWVGLTLSYYLNLAPGGTIVLTSVAILVVAMMVGKIKKK